MSELRIWAGPSEVWAQVPICLASKASASLTRVTRLTHAASASSLLRCVAAGQQRRNDGGLGQGDEEHGG